MDWTTQGRRGRARTIRPQSILVYLYILSVATRERERESFMQLRSSLTVFAVTVLYSLTLASGSTQISQPSRPIVVGGSEGIDGSNCNTTKANFDLIAHTAGDEETIIVIGRLGRGESSRELVRRRLRNLQEFINFT